jgi:large subunit ribosomal protein L31
MKKDTHPKYYPEAKVSCACGKKFMVGATVPEINIEICSHCHPFYTGTQELIDTAGRVEKFKTRREKARIGTRPQALGSRKTKSKSKA